MKNNDNEIFVAAFLFERAPNSLQCKVDVVLFS